MNVKIYSRKAKEKFIGEGFPEKTAVISFYDPPKKNISMEDYAPVDYTGVTDRLFQIALYDIDYTILDEYTVTYDKYFAEAEELSEFTLDKWIALYQKAKTVKAEKEVRYQQEAVKVERVPHEIPYTDIEVSLGVPWISADIVDEFISHLIDMTPNFYYANQQSWVNYEPVTGCWSVNGKRSKYLNVNATVKYGIPRYDALCIIEATLNLREIKIFDNGTQYNETDTIAALEKQKEKIFTTLYPKARVLTIEPKTYKPQMRHKVLTQIKDGDYDGIIIAYSCFEMIPLSLDYVTNEMNKKLSILDEAVRKLKTNTGWVWGESPLRREKDYIWKLTQDFLNSMNCENNGITFDKLEINTIFLDEAHNYKNIPLRSKMKDINGINIKGSPKCTDMMQKIRCVQQNNGGRGAVLATGTPLCNSISDAYAMQMYLQYDKLCEIDLEKFDNWVKTFALPEQLCEIDVDTSKFRFVRRFSRFFNLPELSKMFSEVAVFHAMDQKDGLPVLEDYSDVVIEKNKSLSDYMQQLCERTELIRMKAVDRCKDNMLKVSTDGRKAALDLELVGETQPDKTSKVFRCADKVTAIYKKHQGCSQLVFCDYSTPKGENFSVYEKLKGYLINRGISEKEIAFIHSYHSESRKLELYRKVNEGKIRVLIGSTFKLGIGANVQTKLKAVHHLDVPWRPADMVQREGRINN